MIIAGVLILAIILLAIFFSYGPNNLSILSQSTVNVNVDGTGKVYWVITGTAENLDSGYSFNYLPPKYTKTDGTGTTVTPQSSLNIVIKTSEKSCTYQLQSKSKTIYSIPIIPLVWYYDWTYTYKVLANSEKTFLIDVTPNRGNKITLDGSLTNSETINDPDGKGSVTIQTQGALGTKYDCPEKSDIAVIGSGTNKKIIDKSDLENDLDSFSSGSLITLIINAVLNYQNVADVMFKNYDTNSIFTGAFTTYPQVTDSYIKGIKDMGNPVFTITADQDYFNSVVYTPPTSSDPYIDIINAPNIKKGSTGSISIVVKNRNSNSGSVTLTLSSPYASFNPSSENFVLTSSSTRSSQESANNIVVDNPITAKVCTNNQFGTNKCDTKTVIQKITGEGLYCGDGICSSNENNATCPQDCYTPGNCFKDESVCTSNNDCCSKSCVNGICKPKTSCSSCWSWLKDKMGIQQSCDIGFFAKIWDSLSCPFYFLKLILVLIASIFGLFFGKQFSEKMFKNLQSWAYWSLGILFAVIIGFLGYMFLTWYFVLPLLIITFVAGIIINAIPGGRFIREKIIG